jgi:hypothetical protein
LDSLLPHADVSLSTCQYFPSRLIVLSDSVPEPLTLERFDKSAARRSASVRLSDSMEVSRTETAMHCERTIATLFCEFDCPRRWRMSTKKRWRKPPPSKPRPEDRFWRRAPGGLLGWSGRVLQPDQQMQRLMPGGTSQLPGMSSGTPSWPRLMIVLSLAEPVHALPRFQRPPGPPGCRQASAAWANVWAAQ